MMIARRLARSGARVVAACGVAIVTVACAVVAGLDGYDIKDDEAGVTIGPDGQVIGPDGQIIGADGQPVEPCPPTSCPPQPLPPAGFTRVVFVDGVGACPPGHDGVASIENPTAGQGACACGGCAIGADCAKGIVQSSFDNGGGACQITGVTTPANDGGCFNDDRNVGDHARVDPPPAISTCNAPGLADRSKVTSSQQRNVCVLSPGNTCAAHACPSLSGLQRSCLMMSPELAAVDAGCPPPAVEKHVVGADFTLTCGACGCTATAACAGQMEFFDGINCQGVPIVTLDAGTCHATSSPHTRSRRWKGFVASQNCVTQPPDTAPVIGLVEKRTICCAP